MTTLLHLDASARPDGLSRKVGHELAASFLAAAGTSGTLVHRDLAAQPVPHIGAAWTEICDNLMRDEITALDRLHLGARTPAQREAWATLEPLLDELVAADLVLVATPMYNYSVPSALKAWIDQVTFPKMDLGHRRFVVVAARGGAYGEGSPRAAVEHQVRYLSDFFVGHFKVPPPEVVAVELANSRVDPGLRDARSAFEASYAVALGQARELGERLGASVAGAAS